MAPQWAGKIISALDRDKGRGGIKKLTALFASYPSFTIFPKKVGSNGTLFIGLSFLVTLKV